MLRIKILNLYVILVFCLTNIVFSQKVLPSISNYLRYGTGRENLGEGGFISKQKKEYFENITDARLFFSDVTFGFRLEYSQPPEYGIPYSGLRKKFVEFEKDNLSIRAGDIYALFNSGLTLNLFENRALAYDNGLEGLKAQYKDRFIAATILGGELYFLEPATLTYPNPRKDNYSIRAANAMISPCKHFSIGGSFVWAKSIQQNFVGLDTIISYIPELSTRIQLLGLDLFGSYVIKRTNINSIDSSRGRAFYGSVSYIGQGYGVTVEYKDYRFDIVNPIQRSFAFRPTRMLPFQNPSIVHKEHSFTLLSRNPHIVDYNDEVGMQVDGFYSFLEHFTLNLNYSMSSRHDAYISKNYVPVKIEKGRPWLPSLTPERSPFWEFYFDIEYSFDENESYLKFGFDRRSEILYEIFASIPEQPHRIAAIPVILQYVFCEPWSIKLISESEWISKFAQEKRNYNQLISVQVAHSPEMSVGFRYETTTSKYEPEGKKDWIAIEGSYQIGTNHVVGLSYGAERGGQVCSNGICRVVNPFNGFRLTLTNNF